MQQVENTKYEIGNKKFAKSYVHLKDGVIVYTENDVDYIKEKMASDETKIWLDIAAILQEEVYPFNKEDILNYGEVLEARKTEECL